MQEVAEPWLVLSSEWISRLAWLGRIRDGCAFLGLTVFGGYLADHTDRRRLIFLFSGNSNAVSVHCL